MIDSFAATIVGKSKITFDSEKVRSYNKNSNGEWEILGEESYTVDGDTITLGGNMAGTIFKIDGKKIISEFEAISGVLMRMILER
jgi:hypothetical protein